jgi:transposase
MNQGQPINLTDEPRSELERRVRSQTLDARSVKRARIVLLAAEGAGNHEIARRLEISRGQVIAWRNRFAQGGVAAISANLPRSGRKPRIDAAEIVRVTTPTIPEGATHWSTRKLAKSHSCQPQTWFEEKRSTTLAETSTWTDRLEIGECYSGISR